MSSGFAGMFTAMGSYYDSHEYRVTEAMATGPANVQACLDANRECVAALERVSSMAEYDAWRESTGHYCPVASKWHRMPFEDARAAILAEAVRGAAAQTEALRRLALDPSEERRAMRALGGSDEEDA